MFPKLEVALFWFTMVVVVTPRCVANHHSLLESTGTSYKTCPPWTLPATNNTCQCVNNPEGIVECLDNNMTLTLPFCFCMSHNEVKNTTVVGYCFVRCNMKNSPLAVSPNHAPFRYRIGRKGYTDAKVDNNAVCKDLQMNRTGQLCGRCKKGYTFPVYSYSLSCVECSDYKYNWLKYITVAYLPLTLFYFLAIVFRISVNSNKLQGYVVGTQIAVSPSIIRLLLLSYSSSIHHPAKLWSMKVLITFYSIWNLDFFRSLYPPFCIHPNMTTLQVLTLDYAVAVYPLVLVCMTYAFVHLHEHFHLVVWICRPFNRCCIKIRREWNLKRSLVDTFATFLLLSYVKILNTCCDLFNPIIVFAMNGKTSDQWYLAIDGTVAFFGTKHLPYALLALLMFLLFNILPFLLLCLYPCRCFHKCLNACKLHSQVLHTFVEVFQGNFKAHPRDCRHFAGFYLLLRIFSNFLLALLNGVDYFPAATVIFVITVLSIAIIQPYSSPVQSKLDMSLFAALAILAQGFPTVIVMEDMSYHFALSVFKVLYFILLGMHAVYGVVLLVSIFVPVKLKTVVVQRLKLAGKSIARHVSITDSEESLPHRVEHGSEYAPLIQVST